jgi:hypothetical protein
MLITRAILNIYITSLEITLEHAVTTLRVKFLLVLVADTQA